MDPDFRAVLVLRDVEDLSYEEIAAITGLPDGTVKSRIHRGRAQLRALVEKAMGEKLRTGT
jgi:RNA polymerase sigma-70 factor (ECF subfamily)